MQYLLIAVAGALFLAACAALGLVFASAGFCTGVFFWGAGLRDALRSPEPETDTPAILIYPHRRAWLDLERAAGLSWARMETAAREWLGWEVTPAGHGLAIGAYAGTLSTIALASALHGIGIGVCVFLSHFARGLLRLAELVRTWTLDLSPLCRHCGRPFDRPVFVCGVCHREHPALAPGPFGHGSHLCRCGTRLPALSWNQTPSMVALCPKPRCRQRVDISQQAPVRLALAGGPSQGKTHFLIRALRDLSERRAGRGLYTMEPGQDVDRRAVAGMLRAHEARSVRATSSDVPLALELRLSGEGAGQGRSLHVYDPGGGSFQPGGNRSRHPYYAFVDAVVFVIDAAALSAAAAASLLSHGRLLSAAPPGDCDPEEAFANFKNALWAARKLPLKSKCRLPLCVALTKMDAPEMLARLAEMPGGGTSERCENFLRRTGQGGLVDHIKSSFPRVRFFALGEFSSGSGNPDAEQSSAALLWTFKHRRRTVRDRVCSAIPRMRSESAAGK